MENVGFQVTHHIQTMLHLPCRILGLKTPDPDRWVTSDVTMGMVFLSQKLEFWAIPLSSTTICFFTQSRLSSIDWVLMHLIVANILTLLCKWMPQTMAGFGWKDFLNNFVCKRLFYFHRVGTSVSISNTSLPRYLTRPSLSALMTQSG